VEAGRGDVRVQQTVGEQQVGEDARLERPQRRLHERRDLAGRAPPAAPDGRVRKLEVRRVELADSIIAEPRPETDRARARLVADHPKGQLEALFLSPIAMVGGAHGQYPPESASKSAKASLTTNGILGPYMVTIVGKRL